MKMAPQPSKEQVELDMERKEELILAKQLRACRVNILPRMDLQSFGFKKPEPPPAPRKKSLQLPQPKAEHVRKASNPVALRYWNQCMSAAEGNQSPTTQPTNDQRQGEFDTLDLPWLSKSDVEQSPSPNPSPALNKPKISVPDIRRHMQEVKSNTNWEEILREDQVYQDLKVDKPKFYRQTRHSAVQQQRTQKHTTFTTGQNMSNSVHANSPRHPGQQPETKHIRNSQVEPPAPPKPKHLSNPKPAATNPTQLRQPQRDHDDPSPMNDRRNVVYDKILSTAGQGITRDNEKTEAKMNLNRFITIGMMKNDAAGPDRKSSFIGGSGPSTISDQKAKVPTNRDQDRTNVPSLPKKDSFKAADNGSPSSVGRHQGQGQFQFKSQKLIQEKQFLQQVTKDGGTDKQFLETRTATMKKDDASISSNYSSFDSESDMELAQEDGPVTKDKVENSSERNELTSKKGQLPTSSDNNGQTARSSGSNGLTVIRGDRNGQHVSSSDNRGQTATSSGASDGQTSSEATSDHSQVVLNYLNYADIKDIGCCVVDKLDEMRKNALGMLLYREMSAGLVKEILAQELLSKSSAEILTMLHSLQPQVLDSLIVQLATQSNSAVQTSLVNKLSRQDSLTDRLAAADKQERRAILARFKDDLYDDDKEDKRMSETIKTDGEELARIPDIVVSPDNDEMDSETEDRSDAFLSVYSDNPEREANSRSFKEDDKLLNSTKEEGEEEEFEEEIWEEGEEWEEEEDEYIVDTFDGSFSITL